MKSDDPQYTSVLSMHDTGPAPEAAIVRDIIKRGMFVAPVIIGVSALFWGANGAWSGAYGLAIVLGNFAVAAWMVSYTAKISYALMMGATLFGYIARLAVIAAAVFLVRNASWVELVPAASAALGGVAVACDAIKRTCDDSFRALSFFLHSPG